MKLSMCTYPDPVLARTADPIEEITPEIKKLAEDMAETMYAEDGIGLAAPQVGQSIRLIVVDVTGPKLREGLITLINPVITARDGEVETEEGCLSCPNLQCKVTRSATVTVEGIDLNGDTITIDADEILAVCLQHEIDHLEGIILVDKISRLKRVLYDKKVKKWLNKAAS